MLVFGPPEINNRLLALYGGGSSHDVALIGSVISHHLLAVQIIASGLKGSLVDVDNLILAKWQVHLPFHRQLVDEGLLRVLLQVWAFQTLS